MSSSSSTTTTTIFRLGHEGVIFAAKLLDENGNARHLANNTDLQVIFTKPDGTRIIKDKDTDGVEPADSQQLNDTEIQWENTGASILDQAGPWSFYVAARFSEDNYIPSYEEVNFWVVA